MAQGTNWEQLYAQANSAQDQKELEALMVKCGVGKSDLFRTVRSAVAHYAYGRNYRAGRQQSMKELKQEIARLQKQLA